MQPILSDSDVLQQVIRDHLRLVYSAALRQTRDAHLAEDVTQAVFILFMRKRHSIPAEHLAGWLIKAAYFTSKGVMRAARRSQYYEEQAAMNNLNHSTEASSELAEVLDQAMAGLPTRSRTAVVLRYLEGQSVSEVAGTLRISENAASKIILRGLTKLRRILGRNGPTLSLAPAALTVALADIAAKSSSMDFSHLAGTVLAHYAAPATNMSALAHAAAKWMFWAKVRAVSLGMGLALLLGSTGAIVLHYLIPRQPAVAAIALPTTTPATQPSSGVVIRDLGYKLGPIKIIPIPEMFDSKKTSEYFVSFKQQRIVVPPANLNWNFAIPTTEMKQWAGMNNVDLVLAVAGKDITITGTNAICRADGQTPEDANADSTGALVTTAAWSTMLPHITPPYNFDACTYLHTVVVAQLAPDPVLPGHFALRYRRVEFDPTRPGGDELVLGASEFLLARASQGYINCALRITMDGQRIRRLAQQTNGYMGGLYLNGHLLATGSFSEIPDNYRGVDLYGVLDMPLAQAQAIAARLNRETPDNGYKRFRRLYSLVETESVRHIRPPFPPERQRYAMWGIQWIRPTWLMIFQMEDYGPRWIKQYPSDREATQPKAISLAEIVNDVAALKNYEFVIDPSLRQTNLAGDWVFDRNAAPEARLRGLVRIFSDEIGRPFKAEKRTILRPVIIALGHYDFTPLPQAKYPDAIALATEPREMDSMERPTIKGTWQEMLTNISDDVGVRIESMIDNPPAKLQWIDYPSIWSAYDIARQATDQPRLTLQRYSCSRIPVDRSDEPLIRHGGL